MTISRNHEVAQTDLGTVTFGLNLRYLIAILRRDEIACRSAVSPSATFLQFLGRYWASWTNKSAPRQLPGGSICSPCSTSVQTTSTLPFRSIWNLYAHRDGCAFERCHGFHILDTGKCLLAQRFAGTMPCDPIAPGIFRLHLDFETQIADVWSPSKRVSNQLQKLWSRK